MASQSDVGDFEVAKRGSRDSIFISWAAQGGVKDSLLRGAVARHSIRVQELPAPEQLGVDDRQPRFLADFRPVAMNALNLSVDEGADLGVR
jgi:hypothetical protein